MNPYHWILVMGIGAVTIGLSSLLMVVAAMLIVPPLPEPWHFLFLAALSCIVTIILVLVMGLWIIPYIIGQFDSPHNRH